jgi:hypothetical protein
MPDNTSSIVDQIEKESDYYSPEVYARLSTFSSLEVNPDPTSFEFLPLTPARTNPKVFVIGLIPPPVTIAGRLLDRSASVAATLGAATETVYVDNPAPRADGINNKTALPDGATATSSTDFWDRFVVMCNRLKVQPDQMAKVIQYESGFNPARKSNTSSAIGLNQLSRKQAIGLYYAANKVNANTPGAKEKAEEFFAGYGKLTKEEQLVWVERYFKNRIKPGSTAGQIQALNLGDAYAKLNKNGALYDGNAVAKGYPDGEYQETAYKANIQLDKDKKGYITYDDIEREVGSKPLNPNNQAQLDAAKIRMGSTTQGPTPIIREPVPTNNPESWKETGSLNAQAAARQNAKLSTIGYNGSIDLGKQFLQLQLQTIRATQKAIEDIKNTPPLRMLVNPQSFNVADEKKVSNGNWTRNGPIVEHWGSNQGKLEASGTLGGFYAQDLQRWEMPGLSRTARQYSASYQNFLSLYLLYRNNGGVYLIGQDANDPQRSRLSLVGSVYIYFDGVMYLGSFDDFSITETEGKPHSLDYRFSFTIRARFRLDRPANYEQQVKSIPVKNNQAVLVDNAARNAELDGSARQLFGDASTALNAAGNLISSAVNNSDE